MCLLSLSCPYMSSKLEETEINLEEALQNISASKGQDKEKKELQKLVKQLQASLRDYETRQFLNHPVLSKNQSWN